MTQTRGLVARWDGELILDAVPGLETGRRREDLEDGTRAVAHEGIRLRQDRLVVVLVQAVGARGHHGEHVAVIGGGLDDVHDLGDARSGGRGLIAYCLLRGILCLRVECRGDGVTATRERVYIQALGIQVLEYIVAEEAAVAGSDAAVREQRRLGIDAERLCGGIVSLGLRDVAVGDHGLQDRIAALRDCLLIGVRIEVLRRLDHAGEHGRLWQREVAGVFAEVGACGGLDAVGVVTEGDEVQVVGENLLLAQCLVDLRSHAHLAQLAGDGLLGGGLLILFVLGGDEQQVILHVLLIERRRALGHAAGEDVGGYRTEVALDVHAFVVIEAAILDGDDGVLHRL